MTWFPPGVYEAETFLNSIVPCSGQLSGTDSFSLGRFSDTVWAAKLIRRAMAPIDVSSCVQFLMICASD